MSWQAFSHFLHSSAHAFMCGSEACWSHAWPQRLHASAQAVQTVSVNGPRRGAGGEKRRAARWPGGGPPSRVTKPSLRLLVLGLLLVVLLDVLVDIVGEAQLAVEVAAVGVVGVGDDREVLLRLPLQDGV